MLDVEDIRKQSFIDCEDVTREEAADLARAERWTPHVSDGLDAFAAMVHEAEAAKWSRVITQACADPAFRQRLADNLVEAVKAFGIHVPAGIEIRLVEDAATVRHLILPASGTSLSEADVKARAADLAVAASTVKLPQTWADTWKADLPIPDGGRPIIDSLAAATRTVRLPQTWADTWKPDIPIPDGGRPV